MPGSPTRFPASHDLLPVARCLSALCRRSGNSHSGTPKSHSTAADRCRFFLCSKKAPHQRCFLIFRMPAPAGIHHGKCAQALSRVCSAEGECLRLPLRNKKAPHQRCFLIFRMPAPAGIHHGNARRRFPVYVQPKGNACGFPFVIRKHRISGAFLFAFSPSGTQSSRHPPSCQ